MTGGPVPGPVPGPGPGPGPTNPITTNPPPTTTSTTTSPSPKRRPPPNRTSPPPPNSSLIHLRTYISHPQQQITLTCYIPPSKIGAVIGRGGKTIINLQREASRRSHHPNPIRMSVASDSPPPEQQQQQQLWTPVIIKGDPCGCFAAAYLLLPLVEEEMDDVVLDAPIMRSKHSAIIGRRGNTIAGLSADHNVRIMVPSGGGGRGGSSGVDQPLFPEEGGGATVKRENLNLVQLEGELADVESCLVKMLQVLAPKEQEEERRDVLLSGNGSHVVEKTIAAPPNSEHLVPSLAKLRQIGKKTNTIVRRKRLEKEKERAKEKDADQDEDKAAAQADKFETQFIISGKPDCVDAAIALFEKMFIASDLNQLDDQKKSQVQTNVPTQSAPQTGRGRGKGRGGRGGPGRGANGKPFPRGGRGGRTSSAAATSTPSATS